MGIAESLETPMERVNIFQNYFIVILLKFHETGCISHLGKIYLNSKGYYMNVCGTDCIHLKHLMSVLGGNIMRKYKTSGKILRAFQRILSDHNS